MAGIQDLLELVQLAQNEEVKKQIRSGIEAGREVAGLFAPELEALCLKRAEIDLQVIKKLRHGGLTKEQAVQVRCAQYASGKYASF